MEITVYQCDLCGARVEETLPDDWRAPCEGHPTDDDWCQEWHICPKCQDKPILALKFEDRSKKST